MGEEIPHGQDVGAADPVPGGRGGHGLGRETWLKLRKPHLTPNTLASYEHYGQNQILPAFGAFTGGLDAQDLAIYNACDLAESEHAEALVPTRSGFVRFRLNCAGAFAK